MIKEKKFYDDYKEMFCPVCGEDLVETAPGNWICASDSSHYLENNNLTKCLGLNCNKLVFSKSFTFQELDDKYCNEDYDSEILLVNKLKLRGTCLQLAKVGILKSFTDKGI